MSPPKTASRDPAEYLASVLPLNPIFQAEEILAARDRFLGRTSSAGASSESWQLHEQREALQKKIDQLREQFWTTKPKDLREGLEGLSVDPFPDLKLATERLQAAFRVRIEFPKILQNKHCDQELFDKLKEIAVAAPREAGRAKQAFFLRSSSSTKLHNRCRTMIKMLRSEFPDVFELEREWLQQVEETKPISGQTVSEKEAIQRSKTGVNAGVGWIVACVLLSGLGRAITHFPSRSTPTRSTPTVTPFQQKQQQEALNRVLNSFRKKGGDNLPESSVPPTTPQPEPQDFESIRKRMEKIRQDSRERLDRIPNRPHGVPPPTSGALPPSSPLQPRGP